MVEVEQGRNWHALPASEALEVLETVVDRGLTTQEAARRLERFGPNELPQERGSAAWSVLGRQFRSVMVLVLVAAGAISVASGDFHDAIAILAMVLLTTLLGFRQEYHAERAMEALKRFSAPSARVRRSGLDSTIPARELVPGDMVLLEAGGIVPADVRLIQAHHLSTDESALTGESLPVDKDALSLAAEDAPVADRSNMAHAGTIVTSGRALALVVATGKRTEMGRISAMLETRTRQTTPLQAALDRFGRKLVLVALAGVAFVFIEGWLRGEEKRNLLLTAISLAVAAVPEGLPAVITIQLAMGSQRMLKRRALIRRLAAVETLGSVTVICTDKTGTITENHLQVTEVFVDGRAMQLGGNSEPDPALRLVLACAALSTDVTKSAPPGETTHWHGDPTEIALVEAAASAGLDKEALEREFPRIGELPFDSTRKCMSTLHRVENRGALAALIPTEQPSSQLGITKGALDGLLPRLTREWTAGRIEILTAARRKTIQERHDAMASQGIRVIGVAFRPLEGSLLQADELESDLVFLGLVGMIDPPRPEAAAAVEVAKRAGIRPVLITGDHALTAQYIARQVGIGGDSAPLSSDDLKRLSKTGLDTVLHTAVLARATPEDKLVLIEALQRAGHVVAMTGDGVNDAPALARADVGVAMGRIGTDAAREASDVVLQDDNFATIVAAVEEGRIIRSNIHKFIRYMLACNSGELWVLILAPLFGMPLPLTPLQILWINLITDGLPALALSAEPAEPGIMRQSPRKPGEGLLGARAGFSIFANGLLLGLVTLGCGYVGWHAGQPEWQTMIFTVLTFSQLGFAIACRSERESVFRLGPLSNRPMLYAVSLSALLQLALIYLPLGQSVFSTRALGWGSLVIGLAASTAPFWALEIQKLAARWRQPEKQL